MRCEVKLYVAGTVFNEEVHARDYQEARQVALARNPNARTMPQIFVDDELIGGYTDLMEWIEK